MRERLKFGRSRAEFYSLSPLMATAIFTEPPSWLALLVVLLAAALVGYLIHRLRSVRLRLRERDREIHLDFTPRTEPSPDDEADRPAA